MDRPLISVITVTYNSGLYVRDAIEGVLFQTYPNIEYIIADDCSSDDTWKIIQQYNDPRIRAYRNEKNIGEYANRNKAIDLVTGKYMIFIDGDDLIYDYGIEMYLRMALRFPEAAAVITKGYTNNVIYPYLMQPKELMLNHFFGCDLLQSSFVSNFFLTEAVKKITVPREYIQGDQFLRLSIAVESPVVFIAGYLTWHRETPGQASSKIGGLAGMQESYRMSRRILNNIDFFDESFKRYCIYTMETFFLKISIRCLLKLRISYTFKFWRMSDIPFWKHIREYLYFRKNKIHIPTLLDHTSGNPAKYKKI